MSFLKLSFSAFVFSTLIVGCGAKERPLDQYKWQKAPTETYVFTAEEEEKQTIKKLNETPGTRKEKKPTIRRLSKILSQEELAQLYAAMKSKVQKFGPQNYSQKRIGRLTCVKTQIEYECLVNLSKNASLALKDKTIYQYLNLEEKYTTPEGIVGVSSFEKQVGKFFCEKSGAVVPNPVYHYHCGLKD